MRKYQKEAFESKKWREANLFVTSRKTNILPWQVSCVTRSRTKRVFRLRPHEEVPEGGFVSKKWTEANLFVIPIKRSWDLRQCKLNLKKQQNRDLQILCMIVVVNSNPSVGTVTIERERRELFCSRNLKFVEALYACGAHSAGVFRWVFQCGIFAWNLWKIDTKSSKNEDELCAQQAHSSAAEWHESWDHTQLIIPWPFWVTHSHGFLMTSTASPP